jgi:hypothetical protein
MVTEIAESPSLDLLFLTEPERTVEPCDQADPERRLPRTSMNKNLKTGFIRG